LVALRSALLRLHKSLIEMERRKYEKEFGAVNVGEYFRLVVDHPQFAWLHNIRSLWCELTKHSPATHP